MTETNEPKLHQAMNEQAVDNENVAVASVGKDSAQEPAAFGKFVKEIRNETMKLSRERLGMLLGVSKGHVLKWENGSTNMSKSAKYLFFDQVQRHLQEHRLQWDALPGQWFKWIPLDYMKTRGWTYEDENKVGSSTSVTGNWSPPAMPFSLNSEFGGLAPLQAGNPVTSVFLKKRTKRTLKHEEAEEKLRREQQGKRSMMVSGEAESLLKELKKLLLQSQIWRDEINTARNQFDLQVDSSGPIGELTRVFTSRLDEKNDIIRAKDDLIQLLRDKINSLENRIRILNPDFFAVAEENIIQANKEALGSHMKEQKGDRMDTLKQFEEHYAKEIDSSYKGKIPRFMPEDHTKFDH